MTNHLISLCSNGHVLSCLVDYKWIIIQQFLQKLFPKIIEKVLENRSYLLLVLSILLPWLSHFVCSDFSNTWILIKPSSKSNFIHSFSERRKHIHCVGTCKWLHTTQVRGIRTNHAEFSFAAYNMCFAAFPQTVPDGIRRLWEAHCIQKHTPPFDNPSVAILLCKSSGSLAHLILK